MKHIRKITRLAYPQRCSSTGTAQLLMSTLLLYAFVYFFIGPMANSIKYLQGEEKGQGPSTLV